MDMRDAIIPKSDQLNADDLIAGELTIRITGVEVKGGQEQPVSIHFEGDNGKPYKACKSMCRVMVTAWGADSSKYVGRSMTLYRDPKVKWGGMEVGGIRISHMSHIDSALTMALTMTRANKKPYTVRPLKSQSGDEGEKGTAAAQDLAQMDRASGKSPVGEDTEGRRFESGNSAPAAAPVFISAEQIREIETLCEMKDIKGRLSAKLAASKIKSVGEIPTDKFAAIVAWADQA